ncbi:efflux RND transporter periplasmic adaptor subunit [Bacillus sp. Marseille-Q1617]|uniref:efflux RND transporter periplasmic adaptor subunit n=1 Tax=Bacillus sp. Marseille-Q1617 TaxID=2736887 RepID=UPI00158B625E|nr:efflux RND transporter periplasmic adaptor subunit [Bacillus sp. Marseille-Q1617]
MTTKKKLIIAISIILLLGVIIFNVIRVNSKQVVMVDVTKPETMDMTDPVIAPATLDIKEYQQVMYDANKGEIVKFFVKAGDTVTKDQDLFVYSGGNLEYEKEANQLSVERGYISVNDVLGQIEKVYSDIAELTKEVGKEKAQKEYAEQLNQLETQKKLANLDLKQALLDKEQLNARASDLKVKSKVEGTIISINEDSQATMEGAQEPVITIASLDHYLLKGSISGYDALKVKEGQKVNITSDVVPDEKWSGTVSKVSELPESYGSNPTDTTNSLKYTVLIESEDNFHLKPGYEMVAEIITDTKKVLTIPNEAIVMDDSQSYVFVVKKGRAVRQEIETGLTTIKRVEVIKGLTLEDQVIVSPKEDMAENTEVSIND